jgi:hypothetical protein
MTYRGYYSRSSLGLANRPPGSPRPGEARSQGEPYLRRARTSQLPARVEQESDVTDVTAPTFDRDIRPLFRESDRNAMIAAFDVWSFDDVKANADAILGAVRSGSMPCDMQWPEEQGDLLQRWIDGGTPQ